jgi:hypothetical protein
MGRWYYPDENIPHSMMAMQEVLELEKNLPFRRLKMFFFFVSI